MVTEKPSMGGWITRSSRACKLTAITPQKHRIDPTPQISKRWVPQPIARLSQWVRVFIAPVEALTKIAG